MSNLLSPKYSGEKIVVTMEFGQSLTTGETLTGSPEVEVETNSGVDESPQAILNGDPLIVGTQIRIPVQGGIAANSYLIKATCNTSNPQKVLQMAAILPIYAI